MKPKIIIPFLLFLASCEPNTSAFSSFNNDVSINLILRTDLDSQSLSLTNVRKFSDQSFFAITNATISITDQNNNIWTAYFNSSNTLYIFKSLKPIYNQLYYLNVSLNSGKIITGNTTIPYKKNISYANLSFNWTPTPNTASRLFVKGIDTTTNIFKETTITTFYDWNGATLNNQLTIPQSFTFFSGNASSDKQIIHTFKPNKYYHIKFETYDTNMTSFSTQALDRKGLNQDYGVFGSTAVIDTIMKLSN